MHCSDAPVEWIPGSGGGGARGGGDTLGGVQQSAELTTQISHRSQSSSSVGSSRASSISVSIFNCFWLASSDPHQPRTMGTTKGCGSPCRSVGNVLALKRMQMMYDGKMVVAGTLKNSCCCRMVGLLSRERGSEQVHAMQGSRDDMATKNGKMVGGKD